MRLSSLQKNCTTLICQGYSVFMVTMIIYFDYFFLCIVVLLLL